ncbi:hypothetical protein GM3708_2884 [Geminocystis sp. NIES-3708]|nr:hypothetical protein GM3708_2884 [Geminocystis sp. NIES-3708]
MLFLLGMKDKANNEGQWAKGKGQWAKEIINIINFRLRILK